MNLNNLSKIFQNNATKENSDNSEIFYNNNLYPDMPTQSQKQEVTDTNKLAELISLMNLINSKDGFNLKALLSSPLGKNLGVDPNTVALINMLSSTNKKTKTMSSKATLPKIDSLEKIKQD